MENNYEKYEHSIGKIIVQLETVRNYVRNQDSHHDTFSA